MNEELRKFISEIKKLVIQLMIIAVVVAIVGGLLLVVIKGWIALGLSKVKPATYIAIASILWGIFTYRRTKIHDAKMYAVKKRPILGIVMSGEFKQDLDRNFDSKVVYRNRDVAENILDNQAKGNKNYYFPGIFNYGKEDLKSVEFAFLKDQNTKASEILIYRVLKANCCLYPVPELYSDIISKPDFDRITMVVRGITVAEEVIYITRNYFINESGLISEKAKGNMTIISEKNRYKVLQKDAWVIAKSWWYKSEIESLEKIFDRENVEIGTGFENQFKKDRSSKAGSEIVEKKKISKSLLLLILIVCFMIRK